MATSSAVVARRPQSRFKYALFSILGLMFLFVLWNNERFIIDHSHPDWTYYLPVRYLLIPHGLGGLTALALLAVGIIYEKFPVRWLIYAGNCFIIGIILFSGSLYALAILRAADMSFDKIGIVTPLGGLFFIAGWLSLFIGMIRS